MTDTSPEAEAFLNARYAALSGSERLMMALKMFETAQRIVLSSLDAGLDEKARRRELCRRFYGAELASAVFADSPGGEVNNANNAGQSPIVSSEGR